MKESERIAFWVSKTSFLEQQLNGNTEELERMRGRMVADCLCEYQRSGHHLVMLR